MIDLHARKIKDTDGNNMVVLPEVEFDALLKQIEEIEDAQAYDEGMAEDPNEHTSLEELLKLREQRYGKIQD